MPFPFTIKYSRTIRESISVEKYPTVLHYISELLADKPAKDFIIENNTLKFKPGSAFWNWNIMVPIDKGTFKITEKSDGVVLTYEFFMYKLFIFTSVMSILFGTVSKEIWVSIGAFTWLCGMNWILALIRHKGMFDEIADNTAVFIVNQNISDSTSHPLTSSF